MASHGMALRTRNKNKKYVEDDDSDSSKKQLSVEIKTKNVNKGRPRNSRFKNNSYKSKTEALSEKERLHLIIVGEQMESAAETTTPPIPLIEAVESTSTSRPMNLNEESNPSTPRGREFYDLVYSDDSDSEKITKLENTAAKLLNAAELVKKQKELKRELRETRLRMQSALESPELLAFRKRKKGSGPTVSSTPKNDQTDGHNGKNDASSVNNSRQTISLDSIDLERTISRLMDEKIAELFSCQVDLTEKGRRGRKPLPSTSKKVVEKVNKSHMNPTEEAATSDDDICSDAVLLSDFEVDEALNESTINEEESRNESGANNQSNANHSRQLKSTEEKERHKNSEEICADAALLSDLEPGESLNEQTKSLEESHNRSQPNKTISRRDSEEILQIPDKSSQITVASSNGGEAFHDEDPLPSMVWEEALHIAERTANTYETIPLSGEVEKTIESMIQDWGSEDSSKNMDSPAKKINSNATPMKKLKWKAKFRRVSPYYDHLGSPSKSNSSPRQISAKIIDDDSQSEISSTPLKKRSISKNLTSKSPGKNSFVETVKSHSQENNIKEIPTSVVNAESMNETIENLEKRLSPKVNLKNSPIISKMVKNLAEVVEVPSLPESNKAKKIDKKFSKSQLPTSSGDEEIASSEPVGRSASTDQGYSSKSSSPRAAAAAAEKIKETVQSTSETYDLESEDIVESRAVSTENADPGDGNQSSDSEDNCSLSSDDSNISDEHRNKLPLEEIRKKLTEYVTAIVNKMSSDEDDIIETSQESVANVGSKPDYDKTTDFVVVQEGESRNEEIQGKGTISERTSEGLEATIKSRTQQVTKENSVRRHNQNGAKEMEIDGEDSNQDYEVTEVLESGDKMCLEEKRNEQEKSDFSADEPMEEIPRSAIVNVNIENGTLLINKRKCPDALTSKERPTKIRKIDHEHKESESDSSDVIEDNQTNKKVEKRYDTFNEAHVEKEMIEISYQPPVTRPNHVDIIESTNEISCGQVDEGKQKEHLSISKKFTQECATVGVSKEKDETIDHKEDVESSEPSSDNDAAEIVQKSGTMAVNRKNDIRSPNKKINHTEEIKSDLSSSDGEIIDVQKSCNSGKVNQKVRNKILNKRMSPCSEDSDSSFCEEIINESRKKMPPAEIKKKLSQILRGMIKDDTSSDDEVDEPSERLKIDLHSSEEKDKHNVLDVVQDVPIQCSLNKEEEIKESDGSDFSSEDEEPSLVLAQVVRSEQDVIKSSATLVTQASLLGRVQGHEPEETDDTSEEEEKAVESVEEKIINKGELATQPKFVFKEIKSDESSDEEDSETSSSSDDARPSFSRFPKTIDHVNLASSGSESESDSVLKVNHEPSVAETRKQPDPSPSNDEIGRNEGKETENNEVVDAKKDEPDSDSFEDSSSEEEKYNTAIVEKVPTPTKKIVLIDSEESSSDEDEKPPVANPSVLNIVDRFKQKMQKNVFLDSESDDSDEENKKEDTGTNDENLTSSSKPFYCLPNDETSSDDGGDDVKEVKNQSHLFGDGYQEVCDVVIKEDTDEDVKEDENDALWVTLSQNNASLTERIERRSFSNNDKDISGIELLTSNDDSYVNLEKKKSKKKKKKKKEKKAPESNEEIEAEVSPTKKAKKAPKNKKKPQEEESQASETPALMEKETEEEDEMAAPKKTKKGKNKETKDTKTKKNKKTENEENAAESTKRKKKAEKRDESEKEALLENDESNEKVTISHLPAHFLNDLAAVKPHSSIRKQQAKTDKKKEKKTKKNQLEETENFIPLEATGSTKFAAVPLTAVGATGREFAAADFKNITLKGDRVKRTPAKNLQVVKMKQKAA